MAPKKNKGKSVAHALLVHLFQGNRGLMRYDEQCGERAVVLQRMIVDREHERGNATPLHPPPPPT